MKRKLNLLSAFVAFFVLATASGVSAQNNLGLENVFPSGGFLEGGKINLQAVVSLVFGILVGIGILWTVWRIIATAFKLSNANGEADKRKEVYTSIAEISGSIVLIVLAFPLSSTIQSFVGGGVNAIIGSPCSGRATDGGQVLFGAYVEDVKSNNGSVLCSVRTASGTVITVTPEEKEK